MKELLFTIGVYSILAVLLFSLGWHAYKREQKLGVTPKKHPFFSWEILTSLLLLTVFFGFRYNTGSDYMMYLEQYFRVKHYGNFIREGGIEYGFRWITKLFATNGVHFTLYFAFWIFLQVALFYYALRKHKFLLPWAIFIAILGPFLFNWLSFMRQWVVTMLIVSMLPLLYERNIRSFILYTIISLVASSIHMSALLLIPLYFLPYEKLSQYNTKTYVIIFITCILLGIWPIWIKVLGPLSKLLPMVGYERYASMMQTVADGELNLMNWGPRHSIFVLIQLIAILLYPRVREIRKEDKFLSHVFVVAFVGICYDNLMKNTIYFLMRPADLCFGCAIVLMAYACHWLYVKKKFILLGGFLAISALYVFLSLYIATAYPNEFSTCMMYHYFKFRF